MTLLRGLDLLKDLKDLELVELENMDVYIDGDKEQSWFAGHWLRVCIETGHPKTTSKIIPFVASQFRSCATIIQNGGACGGTVNVQGELTYER